MKSISRRKETHFSNVLLILVTCIIAFVTATIIFFVNFLEVLGSYSNLLSCTIRSEIMSCGFEQKNDYLFDAGKDEYFYADKDNVICDASNPQIIGKKVYQITSLDLHSNSSEVMDATILGKTCMVKIQNFDRGTVVAYVPFSAVGWKALRGVFVTIILIVFIEIALALYVCFARLHRVSNDKKEGYKLIGKYFWDKRLSSHIFVISVFSYILLAVSVFYIQLIISYCDQSIQAKRDLELIQEYSLVNEKNGVEENGAKENDSDPLKSFDFGTSMLIRINTSNTRIMDVLDPVTKTITTRNNSLTTDVFEDGFSGIRRIENSLCYANTRQIGENTYISAAFVSGLGISISVVLCVILLLSLLVTLIVLNLATAYRAESNDVVDRKNIVISEEIMDEKLRNVIKIFLVVEGISLLTILLSDYFISNPSLLSFLMSNNWKKGFNLFSVTMILIIVVTAYIFAFVCIKLIGILGKNMGPRGITVTRLLCSLIKFVMFLLVFIVSLLQLGINVGALLAGAGIAGAAVSFCAQNTVNDLLSGFFIVFEGSFKIGDWIMVDDWRGQVTEIGMRTTKISFAGITKIVNNSKMVNVTILDDTNSGAVCYIDVAYKEDLRKVIKLIEDNSALLAKKVPGIEAGPFVLGVTGLEESSCRIKVWATCSADLAGSVERGLRLSIKELFAENNIEIPFPQVAVHMESDNK